MWDLLTPHLGRCATVLCGMSYERTVLLPARISASEMFANRGTSSVYVFAAMYMDWVKNYMFLLEIVSGVLVTPRGLKRPLDYKLI